MDYIPVPIKQGRIKSGKTNEEQRISNLSASFVNKYEETLVTKFDLPVTQISVPPQVRDSSRLSSVMGAVSNNYSGQAVDSAEASRFAVNSGAIVELYSNTPPHDVLKRLARFPTPVYCSSFRTGDGLLLLAGCQDATLKILDLNSRSILRNFTSHSAPIYFCGWLNKQTVISASDDKTVRVWDVATEKLLEALTKHSNYVRAGSTFGSEHLFLTASYDSKIILWDRRQNSSSISTAPALEITTNTSLSAVLGSVSNNICVAGGANNHVQIFDIRASGKRLYNLDTLHDGTVTCLSWSDDSESCLLTGSSDARVKLVSVQGLPPQVDPWTEIASWKHDFPVTCCGFTHELGNLIVGGADGSLRVRTRKTRKRKTPETKNIAKILKTRNTRFNSRYWLQMRGGVQTSKQIVVRVSRPEIGKKKQKLKRWDLLLKKFEYRRAVDEVIRAQRGQFLEVISVWEELIRRGKNIVQAALSERTEMDVEKIVAWFGRYVQKPEGWKVTFEVMGIVMEIYGGEVIGKRLEREVVRIQGKIGHQLKTMKTMIDMMGHLEMVLNS